MRTVADNNIMRIYYSEGGGGGGGGGAITILYNAY